MICWFSILCSMSMPHHLWQPLLVSPSLHYFWFFSCSSRLWVRFYWVEPLKRVSRNKIFLGSYQFFPLASSHLFCSLFLVCHPRNLLSGSRQQQIVIEEMQVDRTCVQLPSQSRGHTELQSCQLSTFYQPAWLRYEWEYLQGFGEEKEEGIIDETHKTFPSGLCSFLLNSSFKLITSSVSFLLIIHPLETHCPWNFRHYTFMWLYSS